MLLLSEGTELSWNVTGFPYGLFLLPSSAANRLGRLFPARTAGFVRIGSEFAVLLADPIFKVID